MKQKRISTITLIALILIAAVVVGVSLYLISGRKTGGINLGLEDNGKIIDVGMGTIVVIKLPENPSTGYAWRYSVNGNIAEVMENFYIPPENQIEGRGGTRMLKLRVIGSGEFAMDYVRPWENQPISHFSVTFRV